MKIRIWGAILFGLAAVLFGMAFFVSWRSYQTGGAQFLRGAGRQGLTTFDHAAGLGVLALLCGVGFLGCLIALFNSGRSEQSGIGKSADAAESESEHSWFCTGCGEKNPETFDDCWRCHKHRLDEAGL